MLKNNLNKWQIATYFLLIFSILPVNSPINAYVQQSVEVYIFSFPETSRSEIVFSYFNKKSDCNVIFYSLNDSTNSERFLKIVKTLAMLGVAFIKDCPPCHWENVKWDEVCMVYASPLIGFFHNGRLTAITAWITDYKVLDQALMINTDDDLKIFTCYRVYFLTDEGIKFLLEGFFGKESSKIEVNPLDFFLPIILLAFADSVNPCTFAVFTALLLMALHFSGRITAVANGLAFILAIFIGYYALGLGLLQILVHIPFISKVVAVVGLTIGAFSIMGGLKPHFKSTVPKPLRRLTETWISKSYTSLTASFALGLAATFTLLPCTSGPYFVGLGLLSTLRDPFQAYFFLTLYSGIFVSPLILILTALLASSRLVRKIKAFRGSKVGVMELISGTILVLVCVYLLVS